MQWQSPVLRRHALKSHWSPRERFKHPCLICSPKVTSVEDEHVMPVSIVIVLVKQRERLLEHTDRVTAVGAMPDLRKIGDDGFDAERHRAWSPFLDLRILATEARN